MHIYAYILLCYDFLVCYKLFPYSEKSKYTIIDCYVIIVVTISGNHVHQPSPGVAHSLNHAFVWQSVPEYVICAEHCARFRGHSEEQVDSCPALKEFFVLSRRPTVKT